MSLTVIIIIVTVMISVSAFSNSKIWNDLVLHPSRMTSPKELYRLLTSGFIHADWIHLFFNMFTLFFFGRSVEMIYEVYALPAYSFLILYMAGIIVSSIPSVIKHRNNAYYRSLGASGGVSAVLFAFVYFAPWQTIYIWFIPVPTIIAAVAFIGYSVHMSKKGDGTINHDAHYYGALFGFLFTLLLEASHGKIFWDNLLQPSFHF